MQGVGRQRRGWKFDRRRRTGGIGAKDPANTMQFKLWSECVPRTLWAASSALYASGDVLRTQQDRTRPSNGLASPRYPPSVLKRNIAVLARCRTALAIGTFRAHTRHVKGHTNSQALSIAGVGLRIVNYEHSRILSIPGARLPPLAVDGIAHPE